MDDVVDTYELSPLQQGMLFHAVSAHPAGVDIEQITITLRESLDLATFEQAWRDVMQRHPILRTRFRWKDVAEPCQEVLAQLARRLAISMFDVYAGRSRSGPARCRIDRRNEAWVGC